MKGIESLISTSAAKKNTTTFACKEGRIVIDWVSREREAHWRKSEKQNAKKPTPFGLGRNEELWNMGHSLPISEIISHFFGLIVGGILYGIVHACGAGHVPCMWVGGTATVLINLLVGGKINLVMLDILGLLARPFSAWGAVKLLAYVVISIG